MTGNLWDTENGPNYGDEINRVSTVDEAMSKVYEKTRMEK